MPSYRNISFATATSVTDVFDYGLNVTVRGSVTKELVGRLTVLERPAERYLFLPRRRNDVFAQFAETMWVLAGRNDVAWLARYLPRAPEFSDDGITWRGAYGPRLRSWASQVDQLAEVRSLLQRDPTSRRAVMNLFDPTKDFEDSKDIPCNNWLSWIAREGQLHLNVAIRSNDAMWGFSGANAFEWSVLQEIMSYWLNLEVGNATYFATSFHLYERHFKRAQEIGSHFHGFTPYDFGIQTAPFETKWPEFDSRLEQWFRIEEQIRANPDVPLFTHGRTGDPLLDSGLALMQIYWAHQNWGIDRLRHEMAGLPPCDYVAAMYDQLGRLYPSLLVNIAQKPIANFFEVCRNSTANITSAFKSALKKLHSTKNKAYGGAWKRRGELISILPNIARKSDRLEVALITEVELAGETLLDTAVDLYVYVEKYRLFLAEKLDAGVLVPEGSPQALSDHDQNFDLLVDRLDLTPPAQSQGLIIQKVVDSFNAYLAQFETMPSVSERLGAMNELSLLAGQLVASIISTDAGAAARFMSFESST